MLKFYNLRRLYQTAINSIGAESKTLSTDPKKRIIINPNAIKRLKELGTDNGLLRISVEGGGCSGFQYKFDLDSTVNPDDMIIEKDGVKVIVDTASLQYISDSTLDYQDELIRCAFRIVQNPKAGTGCSCGASFSLKDEIT